MSIEKMNKAIEALEELYESRHDMGLSYEEVVMFRSSLAMKLDGLEEWKQKIEEANEQ